TMKLAKSPLVIPGLFALLAGFGFGSVAHAAEPPMPGEPKPFTIPETTEFRLDNGLEATLVPYGNLPKVTVQVVVHTGNLNEGERRWLADFTSALMQEGTINRSAQQVAED